jgi:alpha-ketoglutarate-dependent taurine dioxygenase
VLCAASGGDPPGWVAEHRDALREVVLEHGAVLVRGLELSDPDRVGQVFRALSRGELMADREAFAPRDVYSPGVYSGSKWPANQPMCMHHERSYAAQVPGLLMFACLRAPTDGGATALADAVAVLEALPAAVVSRFAEEGWLLTRTYNEEIGASVGDAFGTDDRAAVEAYCRAEGIDYSWLPGGGLRTRQRRPAVVAHPVSGRRCWFNQVAFLNEWTLDPEVREFLIDSYGADGLPFNTFFGGGEPLSADIVDRINEVYRDHTVREPWRSGDLLLVDNVRTAHSREPFTGPREVLAAMGDPVRFDAVASSSGGR